MAKTVSPLSESKCSAAKSKEKDYCLFDGNGLILYVRTSGTKVWRYKYKRYNGKIGNMTLGPFPALTLKNAREKRRVLEELLANNIDPIDNEQFQISKRITALSFESVTRDWHKEYKNTGRWGELTAERALKNLEDYVFPHIGRKEFDSIKPKDLISVIRSIEELGFTEVVKKTRQRLISIYAYAISRGITENNTAYFLKDVFVKTKKTKHHPQLPLEQLPEFLQRLELDNGYPITKLCVSLALQTFTRSSELRFARWNEFDLKKGIWTLPGTRDLVPGQKFSNRGAKMKEDHLIPLSSSAISILKEIQKYSGMSLNVFPKNGDPNGFISESTINKTLRRIGYDTKTDVCGHGFRGMACSALVQSTLFQKEAVEKQMSHQERDQVRLAYTHQAEYLDERKAMINWWSDYLEANRTEHITPYDFTKQLLGEDVIQFKYAKIVG